MILNLKNNESIDIIARELFQHLKDSAVSVKINNSDIDVNLAVRISKVLINKTNQDGLLYKIQADLALNYAKREHLDYIIYNKNLNLEAYVNNELKILDMVNRALKEDMIVPVFQKISKPGVDSYECLVRIKDGDTLISPFFFLPQIKHTAYYKQLTKVMIKKSCKYFKDRGEKFSINFSFDDLKDTSTVDYLLSNIKQYNLNNRIIIELLETDSMQDMELVQAFIKTVRHEGVQIAIDDFGSGYSNAVCLTKIKPDYIKIDGSIIKNIDKDRDSYLIARHIYKLATDMGCSVIAEFVYSKEVSDTLDELGINMKQGYYISMPKEDV